tara:strand:+ start:4705 stop:5124 length:420 start_codon:yes stop_codon:yes gene_type:complete
MLNCTFFYTGTQKRLDIDVTETKDKIYLERHGFTCEDNTCKLLVSDTFDEVKIPLCESDDAKIVVSSNNTGFCKVTNPPRTDEGKLPPNTNPPYVKIENKYYPVDTYLYTEGEYNNFCRGCRKKGDPFQYGPTGPTCVN